MAPSGLWLDQGATAVSGALEAAWHERYGGRATIEVICAKEGPSRPERRMLEAPKRQGKVQEMVRH